MSRKLTAFVEHLEVGTAVGVAASAVAEHLVGRTQHTRRLALALVVGGVVRVRRVAIGADFEAGGVVRAHARVTRSAVRGRHNVNALRFEWALELLLHAVANERVSRSVVYHWHQRRGTSTFEKESKLSTFTWHDTRSFGE